MPRYSAAYSLRRLRFACVVALSGMLAGCTDSDPAAIPQSVNEAVEEVRTTVEQQPHHLRIGLVRIEVDSTAQAERRLNRLGANWEFIPPNLPAEELEQFDVVYFPSDWGKLDGLAGLQATFYRYVEDGGGLLFAGPNVTGDSEKKPALKLLPFPVSVEAYPHDVGSPSVVEYAPGKPHVLTWDVKQKDLPLPHDAFPSTSDEWVVVAKSSGENRTPTVLTAEVGAGRVLLHSDYDDYGHHYCLSDRFVVRAINWLAHEPDSVVKRWSPRFGARHYPEFVLALQRDYQALISREPKQVKAALEKADALFRNEAQHSSTWTEYRTALRIIHQRRSKAAIPLMLILLNDEDVSNSHFRDSLLESFTLLTGERLPSEDPQIVAETWWQPRKDELTIDLNRMSEQQIQIIVEQLLHIVARSEPMGLGRTPPMDGRTLFAVLDGGYRVYAAEYRWLLNRRLLSTLLDLCDQPDRRWLTPGPLAALYATEAVPELAEFAADLDVAPHVRVVIAAALYRAHATPPAEALVPLWDTVSETDLRQALAVMLASLPDAEAARISVDALVSEETAVREAAEHSLSRHRHAIHLKFPREAIIKKAAADGDLMPLFDILYGNPSPDTTATYVDLIGRFLNNNPEGKALAQAVEAFAERTNVRLGESADPPRVTAVAILNWWDEQQK